MQTKKMIKNSKKLFRKKLVARLKVRSYLFKPLICGCFNNTRVRVHSMKDLHSVQSRIMNTYELFQPSSFAPSRCI